MDSWTPPWNTPPTPPAPAPSSGPVTDLLTAHPATTDALAALLGCEGTWPETGNPASTLLTRHPATAEALAALLTVGEGT